MEHANIASQESVNQAVNQDGHGAEGGLGGPSDSTTAPQHQNQNPNPNPQGSPIVIESTTNNDNIQNPQNNQQNNQQNNGGMDNHPQTPVLSFNSSDDPSLTNGHHYNQPNFPPIYHPAPVYDQYPDDIQRPIVHFLTREVEPQVRYWQTALVGHFVGRVPSEEELQQTLEATWNTNVSIRYYFDDFVLITLPDVEAGERVLAGSPWPLPGCFLLLKLWEAGMTPSLVDIHWIPTRITIWQLPIEYWPFQHLARVVEPLGTLISIEPEYVTYSSLRCTRALILVDIHRRRRYELEVRCGRRINVMAVTYDGNPYVCIVCGAFGHHYVGCQGAPGSGKDWCRMDSGSVVLPPMGHAGGVNGGDQPMQESGQGGQ